MIKIPNSEFKVMRFIWKSESNSITSILIYLTKLSRLD